jgi:hypothetical protein
MKKRFELLNGTSDGELSFKVEDCDCIANFATVLNGDQVALEFELIAGESMAQQKCIELGKISNVCLEHKIDGERLGVYIKDSNSDVHILVLRGSKKDKITVMEIFKNKELQEQVLLPLSDLFVQKEEKVIRPLFHEDGDDDGGEGGKISFTKMSCPKDIRERRYSL